MIGRERQICSALALEKGRLPLKLVRSSVTGAVPRDQAIALLAERAVLTRMVCRELLDTDISRYDRRPITALHQLLQWIAITHADLLQGEPCADDGLAAMAVPDGFEPLVAEITAGAEVCRALFMLTTADTASEVAADRARIRERLQEYWKAFPVPVSVAHSMLP